MPALKLLLSYQTWEEVTRGCGKNLISDLFPNKQEKPKNHIVKQSAKGKLRSSFEHPVTKNNIWVFPDMPHLLKLLRNNFLDQGIRFSDGQTVEKSIVESVIEDQELKLSPKLSTHLTTVKQSARQKVSYAAQLFSHHTATLLKLKYPENNNIFELFETTDKFFDVMNSRFSVDRKKKWHSGFGLDYENQTAIIENMNKLIKSIRIGKHKGLMPFQKGFLMSINSLKGLFEDMKKKNAKYILTCRLNQDVLEGFFSRIRAAGQGYGNPTPSEFKNRIRRILLGAELPLPNSANVTETEPERSVKNPYLTSEMFKSIRNHDNEKKIEDDINECEININEDNPRPDYHQTEALRYIAGYLAYKNHEGKLCSEEDVVDNGWIERLSRGGLTTPSKDLVEIVRVGNEIFEKIHSKEFKWLNRHEKLVGNFLRILQNKFPTASRKLLRRFARTRIFIRIRFLNRNYRYTSDEKRNKKMKKQYAN